LKNKLKIIFIVGFLLVARLLVAVEHDSLFVSTELLGRITDESVTINVVSDTNMYLFFEYGTDASNYSHKTDTVEFFRQIPDEIVLNNLLSDTQYYYRMNYKVAEASDFTVCNESEFHTYRPPGRTYSFAILADPHLDEQSTPEIFTRTLENIESNNPDFMIDLGDNFMSDKLPQIYEWLNEADMSYKEVEDRNILFRDFYDEICHSIPLFLVLGNHEGESGYELNGTEENVAIWDTKARKSYFPNPYPNEFFTGDTTSYEFIGIREAYYAWNWGDATFIVLDPYWSTNNKPGKNGEGWDFSLGFDQYKWLKKTLEESRSKFKFIFVHHLVGGRHELDGRGGSEYAEFYEWGGKNEDGTWGFDEKRPGWDKPIHNLLVENNVSVVFHGHDHFFAKQEKDGVIYQLGPQPSHRNYKNVKVAEEYGYVSGEILPNSGYMNITVSENEVVVDYIRTYLDENIDDDHQNGKVSYSYSINSSTKIENEEKYPNEIKVGQNFPNPFNPSTIIPFQINKNDIVTLDVYNILGQKVKNLVNSELSVGEYEVVFDGTEIASGLYYYILKTNDLSMTKKCLLMK